MSLELAPISFHKIIQSRGYTTLILESNQVKFAIYTEPEVGKNIQTYLAQGKKLRPSSHELIQSIFEGYKIHPIQIVISDMEDSIYFARIFLEMRSGDKKTILEIDARPSDCITLALLFNTPMFCHKQLIDKIVAEQLSV